MSRLVAHDPSPPAHRAAAARRTGAGIVAAALAALLLSPPPAGAVRWARPVTGAVTRGFAMRGSPFAAGQHRGADFEARPGEPVGAPCAGRVVVAGRVGSSGRVVTVACGPWRVTVMPLATVRVHRGGTVRAGVRIGDAARPRTHAGVHLGVRRATDRFGYVDPLRFLPRARRWIPVAPPPGRPGGRLPRTGPRLGPIPRVAPARIPVVGLTPAARTAAGGREVAAWPAWVGAGLLLAGVSGGVLRRRTAARTARLRAEAIAS